MQLQKLGKSPVRVVLHILLQGKCRFGYAPGLSWPHRQQQQ